MKEPTNIVQFECLGESQKVEVLGQIRYHLGGLIVPQSEPGGENAIEGVMDRSVLDKNGQLVEREQEPKRWFEALPVYYHGTYFWARFV